MNSCIGVIGGSGLDNPDLFVPDWEKDFDTPYGAPSSTLRKGHLKDCSTDLVLLSRHGKHHELPPHKVNHRANIAALREAGCTAIVATTACGSLRKDLHPGDLVVPDQFVDFTRNPVTFFDVFEKGQVRHCVMADPFAPAVRGALLDAANECGLAARDGGCVVSIPGPRFSTRAESRMYRTLGCDIINMTVAPECILANEAEIPYGVMAMVTDYDCWDPALPTMGFEEIMAVLATNVANILKILVRAIPRLA